TAKYPEHGDDRFNVAIDYFAKYTYGNGVVMTVSDTGRNGVMFTGTKGRIFVNRGTVAGVAVDALKKEPLPRESFMAHDFDNTSRKERAGKLDAIINHMGNFFDCVAERKTPISDVESQHRSATTCHLGNIAMKVGGKLKWDPKREEFTNNEAANALLKREQRRGFEVVSA
ncbi:MAG: gfo/Idh/MocA family oxidoreductase, partial [Planctomycetaceae bacterium]